LAGDQVPATQTTEIAPSATASQALYTLSQAKTVKIRKLKLRIIDLEKPDLSQSRVSTDPETIAKYKAAWESGEADFFPSIVVFQDGDKYHIADGFQRVQSLMMAKLDKKVEHRTIAAEVHIGTLQQAIAYSLGANLKHGLLPSTADKKRAILLYYSLNPENCLKSNNDVSKICGCSHTFVGGWKTTCLTTPLSIIHAETKIPEHILAETIANLKAAVAEGKIVANRGGKTLVQSKKAPRQPLQGEQIESLTYAAPPKSISRQWLDAPASAKVRKQFIFTNPHDCIPRGQIISGFESLTDPGHISTEWEGQNLLILVNDAIEIPYPIGSTVSPIGREVELVVEGYSLVADDLKIKSIDPFGFAHTHSSTELRPFVKKSLEQKAEQPTAAENNIDAAETSTTPILDLRLYTDEQLRQIIVSIDRELLRRMGMGSQNQPDLAIS
jgi:hypothetical protein